MLHERGASLLLESAQPGNGKAQSAASGRGLPDIGFHDLRHTCPTLLLPKGVHPKVVSEMLGHATIAITLDTYSHVLPDMQDHATRALEDALR